MNTTIETPAALPRPVALSILRTRPAATISALFLAVVLVAALATLPLSLKRYDAQNLTGAIRHPPAWTPPQAWMGYDDLGRSLLFRMLPGLLVSLTIGLAAAATAVTVGTLWGAIAGLLGGRVDLLMMRVVDVLYGLPYLLLVVLLKVSLQPLFRALFPEHPRVADVVILFLAIGAVSWLTMARVVRGQVLALRAQAFVEAARAAGASTRHILRWHLLPNLAGPVIVYASLIVPQAILQEAFLSFLGVGVQPPTPSLGRLAADGVEAVNAFVSFWWLLLFPCAALVSILLALNFLGDALRETWDPKSSSAVIVS